MFDPSILGAVSTMVKADSLPFKLSSVRTVDLGGKVSRGKLLIPFNFFTTS